MGAEKLTVSLNDIREVSFEVLLKCGVPAGDADIIADSILNTHKKGKHTHGIGRLPIYARKIREGLMAAETVMELVQEGGVVSVYDAHHGFGQVAAYKGMQYGVETAQKYGVGIVAIRDSNSFGAAGYYGELAARRGMIGIVMGNASPALAPAGGASAVLGTNPLCYAFPGTKNNPGIVFDMACSVAARGKIRLAAKNGETIPLDWAKDTQGNPTDDPSAALEGSLNPVGGHKGFGLALVVDIMAGLLSGSAFGGDVAPLNAPSKLSRYGHFLAAINLEFFLGEEAYEERMDYLAGQIKASGEPGEVFLPGEKSYLYGKTHPDFVALSTSIVEDVNHLAENLKLEKRLG